MNVSERKVCWSTKWLTSLQTNLIKLETENFLCGQVKYFVKKQKHETIFNQSVFHFQCLRIYLWRIQHE